MKKKWLTKVKSQAAFLYDTFAKLEFIFKFLFWASLILLINYECKIVILFWENKITRGLSSVGIAILNAYVTGFIFYFLIELTKRNKKRSAVFRFVLNKEFEIYERVNFLLEEIIRANKSDPGKYQVDFDKFTKMCSSINIFTKLVRVWIYPQTLTFREFVLRICEDINSNTNDILVHVELFDEQWLKSLSHISDDISNVKSNLELNGIKSTLSLVYGDVWNLYAESQNLHKLANKYYATDRNGSQRISPPGTYIPKDLVFEMEIIHNTGVGKFP
jgi:hypothetical protein